MNQICSHTEDTLQAFNSSFSAKAYIRPRRRGQKITFNSLTASTESPNHWTQKYLPQKTDLLHVLYRGDEVWKLPPPEPCRSRRSRLPVPEPCRILLPNAPTGTQDTKTSPFVSTYRKSLSPSQEAQNENKGLGSRAPAEVITAASAGCNTHRIVHSEEDGCFEEEANLLLTADNLPKKPTSLLQKMGLKLRKTVEYIGASNGSFEEE